MRLLPPSTMKSWSSDICTPSTTRPENVTGVNTPSVAMLLPMDGASTIHSADVAGPEYVRLMANDWPLVLSTRAIRQTDPVSLRTVTVTLSPALTVIEVICCSASGSTSHHGQIQTCPPLYSSWTPAWIRDPFETPSTPTHSLVSPGVGWRVGT